jgi:hypothetical protein
MQKQFNLTATPVMLVALTASMSVMADAVKAQSTEAKPITNESQLIREIGNDPLNVRAVQPVTQVTSVSQLSDVRPTDWAFTALQSLVERYNCIAGYPDRTYRGQRAMTRFEFAAGLNACLDKINEIIAAGLADKVGKDDLEAIARLQEEFAAELASLRGRVDTLEGKVATLERQQFSTTTKLNGEVIFAAFGATDGLSVAPAGAGPDPGVPSGIPGVPPVIPGIGETRFIPASGTSARAGIASQTNIAFGARVRLNFDTSFTGRDLLRTRLQATNVSGFNDVLGSGNSTRLGFGESNSISGSGPNFTVDDFFYRFPIGSTTVWIGPSIGADVVIDPLSPVESSGSGALSRFARYPVALRIGSTDMGLGVRFPLAQGDLNIFYGADSSSATTGGGILGSDSNKIAAQVVWRPSRELSLGFTYAYDYILGNNLDTGTNTAGEILPPVPLSGTAGTGSFSSNTILGQLRWTFARNAEFFTWGSWSFANSIAPSPQAPNGTSGTFTSWLAGLSFTNVFASGDRATIMFGQPFYLSSFSGPLAINPFTSPFYTTPYHLEALYSVRLTRNILLTPGVFFVFNPNNDSRNGTATVGVLRTTFTF